MRRREFIPLIGSALAWPVGALAQKNLKRVGVIYHGGPYGLSIDGLRDGLKVAGLKEGHHVALLLRNLKGDVAEAETAARALERDEKVDVIVAITTTLALRTKRATEKVPIVFAAGANPVTDGLVDSFAAPGGRLTGVHFWTADLAAKRLEILREMVSKVRRVVTFYNPRIPAVVSALAAAQEAAHKLGIDIVAQQVTSPEEVRERLRTLSTADAEAYFFVSDPLVIGHAGSIIDAANTLRLPTMMLDAGGVRAGGLASYGPDFREYGHRPASYVARILAGASPGELPVESVHQQVLAINLRTAKAIGLQISPLLLIRADEVIE